METQHVPAYIAKDAKGDTYARVAPTQFPAKAGRRRPADPPHHRVQQGGAVGRRAGVVRRRARRRPARSTRRPPAVHTFKGKGGATWQIYPPNTAARQEGAAGLEFVRHARRTRRHHLRLQVGEGGGDEGRGARHPARVLPPGEGQEGQGAVGGGEREGRAGRDRAGEGGVPAAARPPTGSPTSRPTRRTVAGRSRGRRPGRSRRSSATAAW